jgi:uncharacterized protein with HEPN domain
MSRDEQERLRDIKDAIVAIRDHLAKAGETSAAKEDPLLHDALLFQFVVIGEAVKHLAPETRESAPEIPWTDIAGLRDLMPTSTSGSIFTAYWRSWSATCRRLNSPSTSCFETDPPALGTSRSRPTPP